MAYQLNLEGTTVKAVEYYKPGKHRSSNGMKAWMNMQLEFDKHPVEVPGLSFVQWLNLLKNKSLIVDKL
jgi:hypothetical protein